MIRTINKSMAEQNTRYENAKDNVDRIDARETYKELNELYEQITQGETMKYLHLRLYVKAKTLDTLERQVQDVMEELEARNFRATIFLNEQEWEWQSLFLSYEQQQKLPNRRRGKEIPSLSIAGGYPFHFTSLQDPTGTYYGTTDTNGSVIFDLFHKDKQRKFYNALMIGKMGSGKSTLLKKTVLDQAIKGNHVRILDVTASSPTSYDSSVERRSHLTAPPDASIRSMSIRRSHMPTARRMRRSRSCNTYRRLRFLSLHQSGSYTGRSERVRDSASATLP